MAVIRALRLPPGAVRLARAAAGLIAVSLAACSDLLDPADAPDKVLFVRHADGAAKGVWHSREADIYRMNVDGTGLENLTAQPGAYASLSLSPDGKRLVFHNIRLGAFSSTIWAMDTDGGNRRQLTTHASATPRWSPDGKLIAFMASSDSGGDHVWVMDAQGQNMRKLSGGAVDGGCPKSNRTRIQLLGWHPDGRVAFSRHICGEGYRFYFVNADGTGLTRTDINLNTSYWSRDGSQVAFERVVGGVGRVFVMSADGSGARMVADSGPAQSLPVRSLPQFVSDYNAWSPDGKRLAYEVGGDASCHKWTVITNVDGSGSVPVCGEFSGWAPGGGRVMLTRYDATETYPVTDLLAVKPDGTGLVNLTNSPDYESSPFWLPDAR